MNEKLRNLFEDLGKPTLRGVRKCPKCGTYNGTRGLSCKNKSCDVIFKETKEKKRILSADAVKIITGSTAQVYSVRFRDRGPDYRGFVQLPLIQGLDNIQETPEVTLITQTAARCFVESCQKSNTQFSSGIALNINPCQHIKAAINCYTEAQPLTLKNSVLNALPVSSEIKQAIWLLATETTGPLVQRVSKTIMVVKCKPDSKHPLGFLNFSFLEVFKKQHSLERRIQCGCKSTKLLKTGSSKEEEYKCVHFYACVCAFASDEKLTEEFRNFINVEISPTMDQTLSSILNIPVHEEEVAKMNIKLIPESRIFNEATEISQIEENRPPRKKKRDDTIVQASTALLTLHDRVSNGTISRTTPKKILSCQMSKKIASLSVDESAISFTFQQWLASVTERINQTMHFQFDGHPEPLVFHAPQAFFDCLQQRISAGSKKKRLPNTTTAFTRKDALPLGMFSKYTWHITNVLHVKQIFDTPEMPLDVTRSFVENRDGTYDSYEPLKDDIEDLTENFKKTDSSPLIKPLELKTFLKVGNMAPDQKEPTPFIVEWIPNILPKSHIGELRIKFEYGHQRNGHVESRSSPSQVIHIQHVCA